MPNELIALLGRIAELHGRSTEICARIRQDAGLIGQVHADLSVALAAAWASLNEMKAVPIVQQPSNPRILRVLEVSRRIGLARSSVWRMVKDGEFPAPKRLSQRAVGWADTDVEAWLSTRQALGSQTSAARNRRR